MEAGARTAEDFNNVVKQWDHLDENRERKERYHEMGRSQQTLILGYTDGQIIPIPFLHYAWREAIKGDFISFIFDTAEDIWQIVEDTDIALQIKALTDKQKVVFFLSTVRYCTPQQIACYQDKTDRAIRKLLTAALDSIRDKLAEIIRKQIKAGAPDMTIAKRQFLEWYENPNRDLDSKKVALDKNKCD